MNDLRQAAEMALEVLTLINQDFEKHRATLLIGRQSELCKASLALRQALSQSVDAVNMSQDRVDETVKSEHEPFIYICEDTEQPFGGYEHCGQHDAGAFPVYLAPPKREWVWLTHEERDEIDQNCRSQMEALFAVEAKLKEKNAGA